MDIEQERKSISLNSEDLTNLIYSYAYHTVPLSKIRYIRKKISEIPELTLGLDRYNDSKQEVLIRSLKFGQA